MRKFKRSTSTIITFILGTIFWSFFMTMIRVEYAEGNLFGDSFTPTGVKLLIRCCLFLLVFVIAEVTLPPNFKYIINVTNDCIIFEISQEDHRRIDKNFTIVNKGKHYMVLDDGISRIRIAYNKEVLQFLKEINN